MDISINDQLRKLGCRRQVGIVKWFGGFKMKLNEVTGGYKQIEQNFGFISRDGLADIFVHTKNVISKRELFENNAVSFEVYTDKKKNKESASKVTLLIDEVDRTIIECCAKDKRETFWIPVLWKYLGLIDENKKIEFLESKLQNVSKWDRENIAAKIPEQLLQGSAYLRSCLSTDKHFDIISKLFKENSISEKDYVTEVIICLKNSYHKIETSKSIPAEIIKANRELRKYLVPELSVPILVQMYQKCLPAQKPEIVEELIQILQEVPLDIWNEIPLSMLSNRGIFGISPIDRKIKFLLAQLDERQNTEEEVCLEIAQLFTLNPKYQSLLESLIPDKIKLNAHIFGLLSTREQINVLNNFSNSEQEKLLSNFSINAKVKYLFKLVKENLPIPAFFDNYADNNPLINCIMIILRSSKNTNNNAFQQMNEVFQNYIVDIAWKSNEMINIDYFLPSCGNEMLKCKHCEGRLWPKVNGVFCPRTKDKCDGGYLWKPRANVDINLDWSEWSIGELLDVQNVIPEVEGLHNPREYANKLAGWVNRLNEIKERLKCKKCGEFMKPNMAYAKYLARYNMTIASCNNHDVGHDHDIYLNHCWGCRAQIDSRENTIQEAGYYLCLECGSGPMNSSFKQGDTCPKCGSTERMVPYENYDRLRRCRHCGHKIKVPPDYNRQNQYNMDDDFSF